jgi:hypothetical protein
MICPIRLKKFEDTLKLWIDDDGRPVAGEESVRILFKAMLMSFTNDVDRSWEFGLADRRLLATDYRKRCQARPAAFVVFLKPRGQSRRDQPEFTSRVGSTTSTTGWAEGSASSTGSGTPKPLSACFATWCSVTG